MNTTRQNSPDSWDEEETQPTATVYHGRGRAAMLFGTPTHSNTAPRPLGRGLTLLMGRGTLTPVTTVPGGLSLRTAAATATTSTDTQWFRQDWEGTRVYPTISAKQYTPVSQDHPPASLIPFWEQRRIIRPEHLNYMTEQVTLEDLDSAARELSYMYHGRLRGALEIPFESVLRKFIIPLHDRRAHVQQQTLTWY